MSAYERPLTARWRVRPPAPRARGAMLSLSGRGRRRLNRVKRVASVYGRGGAGPGAEPGPGPDVHGAEQMTGVEWFIFSLSGGACVLLGAAPARSLTWHQPSMPAQAESIAGELSAIWHCPKPPSMDSNEMLSRLVPSICSTDGTAAVGAIAKACISAR
eukprot:NODE_19383_length_845_cov_4.690808.p2 GENE.NODE_19383_length_845_cov_4.690808~~NODE_19383_length_845_cov_4.690808.p2  ORF type:complete len:159 (-),score=36.10 NODE_19383_length_845_cov_4.690808:212-688(-)